MAARTRNRNRSIWSGILSTKGTIVRSIQYVLYLHQSHQVNVYRAEFIAVKQIFVQEEFDHGNDTSTLCLQRMLPLDKIEREIEIVQSINHRNIVHFYGCGMSIMAVV